MSARAVVLLPTYNERDNLSAVVPAILAAAPVDVWILDDNSPDGTGKIADELAAADTRIRVTHRPGKQGLGRAYLDGFARALEAGYERVLQMDADFSHPVETLPKMLELAERFDVVVGSRWVDGGGTRNWPWHRRLISRGGSWYARTILGSRIRDLTAGFKCWRRDVLAALPLDRIESTGYAFQIEMTYRAQRAGFSVVETPITFVERVEGASKMSKKIVVEAVLRVPRLRLMVPKGRP
jgi:dolichol-phosphate mannosyltransferase